MESKRLGLCQKSLFVVPNHLTEQWASDFLRLYPGANILAATKKIFSRRTGRSSVRESQRGLWCRYYRAYTIWKNSSVGRASGCHHWAPNWRNHTGNSGCKGRQGRALYHQTDGKDKKDAADKIGEVKRYFPERRCCHFWAVRCGQAFCRWKSLLQKPVFTY